jgi:ubiquinone/menaquinone biosynthesis C-methylase UbiE
MALTYTFRDALLPRERILEEAGIKPGMRLLDYGCGPGSYVLPAARLVGESGRVYALDIHPMAIRSVNKIAARERLANVETILSDCDTGLPDAEVEVVLFYDVLHDLGDPDAVLRELHRVLTPDGTLSVRDHHLKQEEILPVVTGSGRFRLREKRRRSYAFVPVRQ